uniref:G protein-coupled receptor n=2 Tax=Caenorhabditis japonica TaxID=281687 RepID=A0A8R1E117_CAEJA
MDKKPIPDFPKFFRESIRTSFEMEINQTAYIAAVFFPPDYHGDPCFSYQCGIGVLFIIAIMLVPFYIVITTGIKSVEKINEFPTSDYGKDLQMQLYKALVAQTLIPVLSLFLPFSGVFLLPLFEIDCALLTNSMMFVYALYPLVDPLPIFFFVRNYRNAVANIFCCKCGRENQIHNMAPPPEITSF